jgi:hypothetical protein
MARARGALGSNRSFGLRMIGSCCVRPPPPGVRFAFACIALHPPHPPHSLHGIARLFSLLLSSTASLDLFYLSTTMLDPFFAFHVVAVAFLAVFRALRARCTFAAATADPISLTFCYCSTLCYSRLSLTLPPLPFLQFFARFARGATFQTVRHFRHWAVFSRYNCFLCSTCCYFRLSLTMLLSPFCARDNFPNGASFSRRSAAAVIGACFRATIAIFHFDGSHHEMPFAMALESARFSPVLFRWRTKSSRSPPPPLPKSKNPRTPPPSTFSI